MITEKCRSDMGWGCMHRSGMMLTKVAAGRAGRKAHVDLASFVEASGVTPGEYSGPYAACVAANKILRALEIRTVLWPKTVATPPCSLPSLPLLVLFAFRLPGAELGDAGAAILCGLLSAPTCCGALGGRGRSGYYIAAAVGLNGRVRVLDPHLGMPAEREIDARSLEPSLAVAYLCRRACEQASLLAFLSSVDGCPPDLVCAIRGESRPVGEVRTADVEGDWVLTC